MIYSYLYEIPKQFRCSGSARCYVSQQEHPKLLCCWSLPKHIEIGDEIFLIVAFESPSSSKSVVYTDLESAQEVFNGMKLHAEKLSKQKYRRYAWAIIPTEAGDYTELNLFDYYDKKRKIQLLSVKVEPEHFLKITKVLDTI